MTTVPPPEPKVALPPGIEWRGVGRIPRDRREVRLPALPDGYRFKAEVRYGVVALSLIREIPAEHKSWTVGEEDSLRSRRAVERAARKLAKVAWLAREIGDDDR